MAAGRFLDPPVPLKIALGGEKIRREVMKYLVTALLLATSMLGTRSASADSLPSWLHLPAFQLGGGDVVPPEWAGIWTVTDTTYDCTGAFKSTSTQVDTLCAGHGFTPGTTITCTGNATSTTFDYTCTGSGEIFTDCNYAINVETHGTRSGESYSSVAVSNFTYSGTGKGCELFQNSCTQINQHGTRTAPPPAAYCASPVKPASWGKVKVLYR
jgi:hypothetical protein